MTNIINWLREKKWDMIIILTLFTIVSLILPVAIKATITDTLSNLLVPVMEDIDEVRGGVKSLERFNMAGLQNSAIVAYNKVETIADLEPLTQNGLAIRDALAYPEIYEALATLDPVRTREFYSYFYIQE